MSAFPKIAAFADAAAFRDHLASLAVALPCDDTILAAPESPLSAPLVYNGRTIGNRFCVQPMEGWDGTECGEPSDYTIRRWCRFGESGAKLIWGGEAVAVLPEARANPNQLLLSERTAPAIARLRESLLTAHRARFGGTEDLFVGLQLTHSGRFCRPTRKDRLEPRILYHHPVLDSRFGIRGDVPLLTDAEVREIISAYRCAAVLAQVAGFDFVDLKHCHGYLGHEFLSAVTRRGEFGGSFENRTRFLVECVEGIRIDAPGLAIGVRLSAFDFIPFRPDPKQSRPGKLGPGIPEEWDPRRPYRAAFGVDAARPDRFRLEETFRFVELLEQLGVRLLNITAGSPYYNPHIQRPASFPPSDGYQPPEDPLVGVARQVAVAAAIKQRYPGMLVVGSGYSYLQEFLPHVAQAVVRSEDADFVGLGRMILAYHELPADVLERGELRAKQLCRTFSDCTTAPRNGMVSGCFPLDPFYKDSPLRAELLKIKRAQGA